jgi:hypothetical protein
MRVFGVELINADGIAVTTTSTALQVANGSFFDTAYDGAPNYSCPRLSRLSKFDLPEF